MTAAVVSIVTGAALLWLAARRRWLTPPATAAAAVVGLAVVIGTGAGGALLLLAFLSSTSVLTRYRAVGKAPLGAEHTTPLGSRKARQVWANGGAAAVCAALSLIPALGHLAAGVAGALAAATADSWATETGTALRGRTVLVTSFRDVSPGTSGGVSVGGTVAGVAGSMFIAGLVAVAPWPGSGPPLAVASAVALSGTAGMLIDSLLGASVEGRRPWIDNEVVNTAATVCGAALAILLT